MNEKKEIQIFITTKITENFKKKQLLLSDWVYFLSFCNVCGAVDHSDVISCEFLYMYSNSVNKMRLFYISYLKLSLFRLETI